MLESKIKLWKMQLEQAEKYGLLFDAQSVKEIMVELVELKKDYEELVEATMV